MQVSLLFSSQISQGVKEGEKKLIANIFRNLPHDFLLAQCVMKS